jgi:hypothetical protein
VSDGPNFLVQVFGAFVHTANGVVQISSQVVDLSSYGVTEGAKFVNIECDDDGALSIHEGVVFDSPTVAAVSDIPVPAAGKYLLATVLLFEGQTQLTNDYIRVPMPLGVTSKTSGLQIHDAEAETTIADDDEIGFWDVVNGLLKKITWANLVALLADIFLSDAPSDGNQYARQDGAWEEVAGTPSPDADAIHVDESGEINGLTEKTTPVAGDFVVIEDSEDGFAKKKVDVDNLLGGGGGTTFYDRRWVRGNTPNALDDEFNDASIDAAWSRVDNTGHTGYVTWAEGADNLSFKVGNSADATAELHALMKSYSMSVGDYIQMSIKGIGVEANYPLAGLIIADGITYGSGAQAFFSVFMAASASFDLATSEWTGYNTRVSFTDHTSKFFAGEIHTRLEYSASNTFKYYVSPDAVQWILLDTRSITMTPSRIGIAGSSWGSGSPFIFAFDYFRVNP